MVHLDHTLVDGGRERDRSKLACLEAQAHPDACRSNLTDREEPAPFCVPLRLVKREELPNFARFAHTDQTRPASIRAEYTAFMAFARSRGFITGKRRTNDSPLRT